MRFGAYITAAWICYVVGPEGENDAAIVASAAMLTSSLPVRFSRECAYRLLRYYKIRIDFVCVLRVVSNKRKEHFAYYYILYA